MVCLSRAGRGGFAGGRMRILRTGSALVVMLFALAGWVVAQTGGQGALEGTVTDPTGAVVGGATVTATNGEQCRDHTDGFVGRIV